MKAVRSPYELACQAFLEGGPREDWIAAHIAELGWHPDKGPTAPLEVANVPPSNEDR